MALRLLKTAGLSSLDTASHAAQKKKTRVFASYMSLDAP